MTLDSLPYALQEKLEGYEWERHGRGHPNSGRIVNEADFDPQRKGRSPVDLLAELRSRRPTSEDLVVTHGDLTLGNILAVGNAISGIIDLGRVGVADRYQDLALAGDSVREEFGEEWMRLFFAKYGTALDGERLDYFQLLDEFF